MYRETEYYNELIKIFDKYGLLKSENVSSNTVLVNGIKILEKCGEDSKIFEKCQNEYGYDIQRIATFNALKYYLWNKEFGILETNHSLFQSAIYFTVFCCLADKILDDNSIDNDRKKEVLQKITSTNTESFTKKDLNNSIGGNVFDYLYENLMCVFSQMKLEDSDRFDVLFQNVKKAFESEVYISTTHLEIDNIGSETVENLAYKSFAFVSAGFQICAFQTREWERMCRCAEYIGKIFWLIDDSCDLYEDIRDKRKNSIIFLGKSKAVRINEAIDYIFINIQDYIAMAADYLKKLKNEVGQELYDFILYIVKDWTEDVVKRF